MRRPLFYIGLTALLLAFLVEIGGAFILSPDPPDPVVLDRYLREEDLGEDERAEAIQEALSLDADEPPGFAVSSLALLDIQLLMSMALLALATVIPHRLQGRIVGLITLIVGLLVIVLGIIQIFVALAALFLMLGLFLSPPFGTLSYLAIYGFFDRPGAATLLGLALALKLGFLALVLLAYPRFIREKGLMLLVATSFVMLLVVAFLHNLVPTVLVSILDALAAIIVSVVAVAWAVTLVVGGVVSVVRVLQITRT